MRPITEEIIRSVAVRLNPRHKHKVQQDHIIGELGETLEDLCVEFEVNTLKRQSSFLAQTGHESAGLRTTQEFASGRAYEGRKNLGNTQPGDGVKFKGHGLKQITGRYNHTKFNEWYKARYPDSNFDFVENPELLMDFPYAIISAFWFWDTHNLNEYADSGDFRGMTKVINGGYNGLADRIEKLAKAKIALDPDSNQKGKLLKLGTQSANVKILQSRLKQVGCLTGAVDGIFGHATESAVRDFQSHNALVIDGKVLLGGTTWDALDEAIEEGHQHPIVESRKEATLKDSRIVGNADKATGAGIVGTGVTGAFAYFGELQAILVPYITMENAKLAIVGGLAFYFWLKLQFSKAARIEDHKTGKTL